MADAQSTVFLSYRRNVSAGYARAVFLDLRQHGYDVFMDVESIDSGQFDTIILNQIAARAHFIVILTPGALEGCQEPNDWLRREIEHAIALGRNVVPILVNEFRFDDAARAHLPETLRALPGYSGVTVHHDYFDAAMERLRTRFLKEPTQGVITPAPPQDAPVVQQILAEAAREATPTTQHEVAPAGVETPNIASRLIKAWLPRGKKWLLVWATTVVALSLLALLLYPIVSVKNRLSWDFIPDPPLTSADRRVASGVVRDGKTRKPVENATVTFQSGSFSRTVYTDSEGLYRIPLPSNSNESKGRITIEKEGYAVSDRHIEISPAKGAQ